METNKVWDNTIYQNNWETASLNIYLNGDYYESLETKNADTIDLISASTWYLGGYSTSDGLYANDIYIYERTNTKGTTIFSSNPFTVTANIGLMYPSDYGYATDLSVCTKNIYNYHGDATNCRSKNWLYVSSTFQWLISPYVTKANGAWYVDQNGYVGSNYTVGNSLGVRPVIYLGPEVVIEDGNLGTNSDPYRIKISE